MAGDAAGEIGGRAERGASLSASGILQVVASPALARLARRRGFGARGRDGGKWSLSGTSPACGSHITERYKYISSIICLQIACVRT